MTRSSSPSIQSERLTAVFGDIDYHEKAQRILDRKSLSEIMDNLIDGFFGTELEFVAWMLEYNPEIPIDDEQE